MKKLLSVLFLLSFTLASVYAQNIQVKGTVVSGSDNEPLPGVNVVVKGTTNGGITDLDGNFTLSVPADATLSITYIGFKSLLRPAFLNLPEELFSRNFFHLPLLLVT